MVTYWVLMVPHSRGRRWWHPFTKGIEHVVLLRYDAARKLWILIEPTPWRLSVRIVPPVEMRDLIVAARELDGVVLTVARKSKPKPRLAIELTCVAGAKWALGLTGWIYTPRQLLRALMRQGAVPKLGSHSRIEEILGGRHRFPEAQEGGARSGDRAAEA